MRVTSVIVGIVVGFILFLQIEAQFDRSATNNVQKMQRVTFSAPRATNSGSDVLFRLIIVSTDKKNNNKKMNNTTAAIFPNEEVANNNKLLFNYWLGREKKCVDAIDFVHEAFPDDMWESVPGSEWDPLREALKAVPVVAVKVGKRKHTDLHLCRTKGSRVDNDDENDGDDEEEQPQPRVRVFHKDITTANPKTQKAFAARIDKVTAPLMVHQTPSGALSSLSKYSTVFGGVVADHLAVAALRASILDNQTNNPLFVQLCSTLFSRQEDDKDEAGKIFGKYHVAIHVHPNYLARAGSRPWGQSRSKNGKASGN